MRKAGKAEAIMVSQKQIQGSRNGRHHSDLFRIAIWKECRTAINIPLMDFLTRQIHTPQRELVLLAVQYIRPTSQPRIHIPRPKSHPRQQLEQPTHILQLQCRRDLTQAGRNRIMAVMRKSHLELIHMLLGMVPKEDSALWKKKKVWEDMADIAVLEAGSIMLASHMQQAVSGTRHTFQSNNSTSRITVTFLDYWRMELVILPAYIDCLIQQNLRLGVKSGRGKAKAIRAFRQARL